MRYGVENDVFGIIETASLMYMAHNRTGHALLFFHTMIHINITDVWQLFVQWRSPSLLASPSSVVEPRHSNVTVFKFKFNQIVNIQINWYWIKTLMSAIQMHTLIVFVYFSSLHSTDWPQIQTVQSLVMFYLQNNRPLSFFFLLFSIKDKTNSMDFQFIFRWMVLFGVCITIASHWVLLHLTWNQIELFCTNTIPISRMTFTTSPFRIHQFNNCIAEMS